MTPDTRTYHLHDMEVTAPGLAAGLYITSTPIGNLRDITLRALETLAGADLIACEDTRVTSRLTRHYGITTPLIAYHEHNAEKQRPKLLAAIREGDVVALVSDAGTPLVSDPGYRLVGEAIESGFDVVPVPGPSALLAGLAGSGLPTDRFLFAGFLPPKKGARQARLRDLAETDATLIFYEAPQRAAASLADMAEILGAERPAAMARELTKKFETFRRASLDDIASNLAQEDTPKGEITILVGPPTEPEENLVDIDSLLIARMKDASLSEAVADVAAATGQARKRIYRRALELKSDDER